MLGGGIHQQMSAMEAAELKGHNGGGGDGDEPAIAPTRLYAGTSMRLSPLHVGANFQPLPEAESPRGRDGAMAPAMSPSSQPSTWTRLPKLLPGVLSPRPADSAWI